MSELIIGVQRVAGRGSFVVHPVGLLTMRNRHQLRVAVLKCLAECPVAVVVDLADLELVDPVAAAVFPALRREAAAGPGVNLLLSGAHDTLTRRITALDPSQPLYRTRAEAIRAIHDSPFVVDWIYRRLPPGPESANLIGHLTTDACTVWHLPHLIQPARTAALDLLHAVHRCPAYDVRYIASHRPAHLILSIRSHLTTGHRPDCIPNRLPRQRTTSPDLPAQPDTTRYHHNVTATGHLSWASLPTGTRGTPEHLPAEPP